MDEARDKVAKRIMTEIIRGVRPERDYSRLGLKFNPFPAAAIPKYPLPPLEKDIEKNIVSFINSTYSSPEEQEYAGLTIVGEYGMGKSHLMMYIKWIIDTLTELGREQEEPLDFSAATCYIDRPEDTPKMVVHKIVEAIGLDNIRKYVWTLLMEELSRDATSFYKRFRPAQQLLGDTEANWLQLFDEPTRSNFKGFMNQFRQLRGDLKRLQEDAKVIISEKGIVDDAALADRYLDLVFEERKADLSWDVLAGYVGSRDMQRKEILFLNSIVKLLRSKGVRQLYVFVDEFEDVSKLKGAKLTNYLLTLNALINKQKRWALAVSLTGEALQKIKEEAPPLHDRLTSYVIELRPLDSSTARKLLVNYLNVARITEDDSISPFLERAAEKIIGIARGNYRSFVRIAHKCLEMALAEGRDSVDEGMVEKAKGFEA